MRPTFLEMMRSASSRIRMCRITAILVVSKWTATAPTLTPGSFFTMSRIRRRVSLPSASNTTSMSSICKENLTYFLEHVNSFEAAGGFGGDLTCI